MHSLPAVQTIAIDARQAAPDARARHWQAEKAGQVAFWAIVLFTAQLFIGPAQWFPVLAPLHHAVVLSAVGLGALGLRRVLSNQPLWMGWRSALLGIYVVEAMLSTTWSMSPHDSVLGATELAKHFLYFTAVVNAFNTPRRVRVAMGIFALASIIPGVGTFYYWMHDELLVDGFRGRWLGVLADPNHDAMALVAAMPLLLFFITGHGHRWPLRIASMIGVVACLAGIVATHSRGGSVGLSVAVAAFALLSRRKALASMMVLVAGAGLLLLAPASFWQRNDTIAMGAEDLSIEGRLEAWQVAGRILKERPILGVGQSAFLVAWDEFAPMDSDRLFGHRYVAHNLVLEIGGQLGVVGIFALFGFIAMAFWSAWRARNGELGGEARAVFAALLGFLTCQMFAGDSMSWFLYALCGFATCCDAWVPKRAEAGPKPA